jgi:Pectate lyase superfamily protein
MSNLTESATWETGVYQLETTDRALGGPSGVLNWAAQALANRTAFLKAQTDALNSSVAEKVNTADLANGSTGYGAAMVAFQKQAVSAAVRSVLDKCSERISVKDFGAVGDGVTDDTAAIQAAIDYIGSISAAPWSSDVSNKPRLYFPGGQYLVGTGLTGSVQVFSPVTFKGFSVSGDGPAQSVIVYVGASTAPVFDIGTFSTTPTDIFDGPQGTYFGDISIWCKTPGAAGSRISQGIRCSGGGGLVLLNVGVIGFQYGVNCPYGGDFNSYFNLQISTCDVGIYQGPKGQQFYLANPYVFGCEEGIVLDRVVHMHCSMPSFINNHLRAVLWECTGNTTTRQLTSFSALGETFFGKYVFDTPWLEGNAGNMGANYVTQNFFENINATSHAYRNIVINNPFIVAGTYTAPGTGVVTQSNSLFANTFGTEAYDVEINKIAFNGLMTQILTAPAGARINGLNVASGSALTNATYQGLSDTNTFSYFDASPLITIPNDPSVSPVEASNTDKHVIGYGKFTHEVSTADNVYRIQEVFDPGNKQVYWDFISSGSFVNRMGIDIENRNIHFGDPTTNDVRLNMGVYTSAPTSGTWSVGCFAFNANPIVSSGKVCIGWMRITTGSGNVLGTDWTPLYGTTS